MKLFAHLRAILGLLAVATSASAYDLPRPACTCKNLESLQQDYQTDVYLEGYERALSAVLKAEEDRAVREHLDVERMAKAKLEKYESANYRLPFSTILGYTGPSDVRMIPDTCEQDPVDLGRVEEGSPCKAMADAVLLHEKAHRDLCNALTPAVYWARPLSEIAMEEAERYKSQAEYLKRELRRVLEASQVELHGRWLSVFSSRGMSIKSLYEVTTGDIGQSSGGDPWTMAGTGEASNSIENATMPGMSCEAGGAARTSLDAVMTTDGLTFALETREGKVTGEMKMNCGAGRGISMPRTEMGSSQLAAKQALKAGDNPLSTDWAEAIKARMASRGIEVMGKPEMVLSVTCVPP